MPNLTPDTMISGAEFRDFYLNNWPGHDWCLEECEVEIEDEEGNFILPDDALFPIKSFGFLAWQGKHKCPHEFGAMFPIFDFFAEYKGANSPTNQIVVARVPTENLAQALAYLEDLGAEIVRGTPVADETPSP